MFYLTLGSIFFFIIFNCLFVSGRLTLCPILHTFSCCLYFLFYFILVMRHLFPRTILFKIVLHTLKSSCLSLYRECQSGSLVWFTNIFQTFRIFLCTHINVFLCFLFLFGFLPPAFVVLLFAIISCTKMNER